MSKLGATLGLDMAIQLAGFAAAATLKTEKFYDLAGSLTYLILAKSTLAKSPGGTRRSVNTHLMMAWAARLGSFLFYRVIKDGGDSRFDKVKFMPRVFLQYWLIQGVWVFLTGLPVWHVLALAIAWLCWSLLRAWLRWRWWSRHGQLSSAATGWLCLPLVRVVAIG